MNKKIWLEKSLSILVGIALLASSFGAGFYSGFEKKLEVQKADTLANKETGKPDSVDFSPFWKAWNQLNEKYVPAHTNATSAPVTDQAKVYGAISGLAASLGDPYTVFFPPAEKQIFDTQVTGDFEGVGMEVGIKNSILTVIAPLKDSPAEKAGIKTGDTILKIDKLSTEGVSIDKAIDLIRGKKGTVVTLSVLRGDKGNPFNVSITRDTINLPTIDTKARPDGIFVISLYGFTATSPDLFQKALTDFIASGDDKLILDLRGNPGGYLDAAVEIGSDFLPAGDVIVQETSGKTDPDQVYKSKGYVEWSDKFKMAVLVDGGSASASEILAGALQEHGRAKLIGTQTFGKGSVQEVVPITDDTSLKVTVARWLTPNGVSISQNGLTPDIVVKQPDAPAGSTVPPTDVQMNRAVKYLTTGK